MRGQKMNSEIIVGNLAEARADLTCIIENAGDPVMSVGVFKSHVEHILHHVLFAWNARHMEIDRYAQMSDEDFARCSRMHDDLVPLGAPCDDAKPELRPGKFDRGAARRHPQRHWTKSEREFTWATRRHRKVRGGWSRASCDAHALDHDATRGRVAPVYSQYPSNVRPAFRLDQVAATSRFWNLLIRAADTPKGQLARRR